MLLQIIGAILFARSAYAREHFIVGGEPAYVENHPWMGSFRDPNGNHFCGTAYIGANYALSAGHCGGNTDCTVEFGTSTRNQGIVFSVVSIELHPNYGDGLDVANDVELITSGETIEGENIFPIKLAPDGSNPATIGIALGFGATCSTCPSSETLKGMQIPILSDEESSEIMGDFYDPSFMICILDNIDYEDSVCYGDSGSPLTVGDTLYGICSFTNSACTAVGGPSCYARVGMYFDWICESTGQLARGCQE